MRLHIDGTDESEDVLVSGAGVAPFFVFDEDAQENIAGPFSNRDSAIAWVKENGLEQHLAVYAGEAA